MAIVNSLAVGKATKTAGELTYAKVRGRTIARRRIISNKSNTAEQQYVRSRFGLLSEFLALVDTWIKANVVPSQYGSARNNVMKTNGMMAYDGITEEDIKTWTYSRAVAEFIDKSPLFQIGQTISGSIEATLGDDEETLTFNAQIADMGYNSVTAVLAQATNTQFLTLPLSLILNNGVWTLTHTRTVSSITLFAALCIYVDGKPIANGSGKWINESLIS